MSTTSLTRLRARQKEFANTRQVMESPHFLFEIFLHLPQQDLLLVQRVSRKWQHVISSSKTLQIALFFLPDTTDDCMSEVDDEDDDSSSSDNQNDPDDDTFGLRARFERAEEYKFVSQLNPLLQDRFPSFFDGKSYSFYHRRQGHNLGPWKELHWYRGKSDGEEKEKAKQPEDPEDEKRMAAFARPEASWRRMIPCRPAPIELQVLFGGGARTLSRGTLKCISFSNELPDRGNDDCRITTSRYGSGAGTGTGTGYGKSSAEKADWLTFGLLYDIAEQPWFRSKSRDVDTFICDFSYRDPSHKAYMNSANISKTELVEALEQTQHHKKVGGARRVLMHLTHRAFCGSNSFRRPKPGTRMGRNGEVVPEYFHYRDEFKSQASVVRVKWDEQIEFEVN